VVLVEEVVAVGYEQKVEVELVAEEGELL